MSSKTQLPQSRLLESPTDVHSQITHKLTEDGLNPECSDLEKLLFLWKLYQHLEDDLQKARETETKLKETQAEEMKEVESYVEHIRHLSDEREALIQELELENEALKGQGNNAEIVEMLTQQGLAEISEATQCEQIAYLLVERARLLDQLEEQNNSNSNNNSPDAEHGASEVELKQILEQERHDFEEELKEQRENAKRMRQQLKQEHEEEINALMEENSKLEEDLQKAEMMVSQLKAELNRYEEEGVDGKLDSSLKSSLGMDEGEKRKLDEQKAKLAEETNELNKQREELEQQVEDLEKERESLKKEKDQLLEEKAALERERSSFTREKSKLDQIRAEVEGEKDDNAREMDILQQAKQSLEKRLTEMERKESQLERQLDDLVKEKDAWEREKQESPRTQSIRNASPIRSPNDLALRKIIEEKTKIEGEMVTMRAQMRSLQKEKDSHDDVVSKLRVDLEKCHVQHQQLQVKNRSLKSELQELEAQLDEAETSVESINKEKQSLSEKYDSLNSEVKSLRADAQKSSTLQDIVDILNNDKKQLSQSLESVKAQLEQMTKERDELTNQNERLSKSEQDLTNKLKACQEDLAKMEKERDHLMGEKHELLNVKQKQEEVETLLRGELDEMGKLKDKFVNQTETLSKENKDLLNKLDRTREELDSAKQQLQELVKQQLVIEHLKDQNQQLQNQVKQVQEELNTSKDREKMLITTQQSLQKSHNDAEKRQAEKYGHEVDDLKLKLELTLQELAKAKKHSEDLTGEKANLADTLKRTEKLLHESAEVKDILEEEKRQRNALKLEVNRLELQLAEKSVIADKFEGERKQRLELEATVGTLRDVEDSLKAVSRELEKERKMRESLEHHTEDLEKAIASRVSKEEFLATQTMAEQEKEQSERLECRVKELERSLKEAGIVSESAAEQLENERELRQSLEMNVKELQASLAQQGAAEELSRLREELSKERAAVRDLQESREDVELLCGELEKERSLRAELTRKVAELEAAQEESSSSTLKATLDELERERRARAQCDMRLQEAEQMLEDQRVDSDNLHHSMSTKMKSLEKRVQALQDDLFTAQDELQSFQERYEEAVHEAEVAKMEVARQSQSAPQLTVPPHNVSSSQRELDLEASLRATTAKLQETLNELNTVKSHLCDTQDDLDTQTVDVDHTRHEVAMLKQSLEMATKQLEQSDEELRTLRRELADANCNLKYTESRLADKQAKLDSVVQDRDEIQRELDAMCDEQNQRVTPRPVDPAFYGEDERTEHVDRISTLEQLSHQLELDNREMARKLSDTMSKCENLEEQLQREKLKSSGKFSATSNYTEQLERDLDSANQHIRQLREDLQQQQTKVFKLEADNLGLAAKYESSIARLEQDLKDCKQRHRQELDSVSGRMEVTSTEARELRGQKRDLELELSSVKQELSRLKSDKECMESHLQAESKRRLDLENRNSVIDNEMTKVWSQVRSLMEKNAELESTARAHEQELNMKKSAMRQVETTLSQKEAAFEVSSKAMASRAEVAEKKLSDLASEADRCKDLQKELEEVTKKLLNVERQLTQADMGKVQLEDTKDRLVSIRNQLEGEKLQRTLLDQTVAELKHQVALLKQREAKVSSENKDLQHTILDLESRLNQLHDQQTTNSTLGYDSSQSMSDVGKRTLMDQIARLQREVKDLQYELYNVSERRDVDTKRYEERKLRTKEKLMKAREYYTNERTKYMDHMKHMDEDLRLTRATLQKEVEWRSKMDDSYKQLLSEKRDLITQLSEQEESLRDKTRQLSMAQVKAKYLEEETSRLQDRLEVMSQQKHNLDKLLKDHGKREKLGGLSSPMEHTGGTSGLGNSLDSAWDGNDKLDSLAHSWSSMPHLEPPANFRQSSGGKKAQEGAGSGKKGSQDVEEGRRSGEGGVVLYPTAGGDYALYSEIEDLRVQDDYDDEEDNDEFSA